MDEYSTVLGMKRALHLMEELGCGKVSRTHFDVNTGNSIDPTPMTVSVSKVNGVLGIESSGSRDSPHYEKPELCTGNQRR